MKKKSGVHIIEDFKCDEKFINKWKIVAKKLYGDTVIFYYLYRRVFGFIWVYETLEINPNRCISYIENFEEMKSLDKEIWRSK